MLKVYAVRTSQVASQTQHNTQRGLISEHKGKIGKQTILMYSVTNAKRDIL